MPGRVLMRSQVLFLVCLVAAKLYAEGPDTLPGSVRWNFPADIVAEQYGELRSYYEQEIASIAGQRRPFDDPEAGRSELRRLIGAIDQFMVPRPQSGPLSDFGPFTASLVQWPVLGVGTEPPTTGSAGTLVHEYGILLSPKAGGQHPAVIVIPDADQSAADIAGLTKRLPAEQQSARVLAASGFVVFAPFFTERRAFSEPWTDDRSWLFRLAYQTGHHLIGSETQQVSSAGDFLKSLPAGGGNRISVAGRGQGGLAALYAAALDRNLSAALV